MGKYYLYNIYDIIKRFAQNGSKGLVLSGLRELVCSSRLFCRLRVETPNVAPVQHLNYVAVGCSAD